MPNVVRHLVAVGATAVWIRFALAPVLTHASAFLSGGSCFIGTAVTVATPGYLDDAYFAWGHQALSLFFAACAATLIGLPAATLFALIRRGYVRQWVAVLLVLVTVAAGGTRFFLCRFPDVMAPPESVTNAWLVILFALGLSISVYWFAFFIAGRFQAASPRPQRLGGV